MHDDFTVTAKNAGGHGSSGSLIIQITDSAPEAKPDTASVTEDKVLEATGNVITGTGADAVGADVTTVVGVAKGAANANKAIEATSTPRSMACTARSPSTPMAPIPIP